MFGMSSRRERVKGLKATDEQQDDGTVVLHQVGTTSNRPSILIYKVPMPLSAHTRPRETRYMAAGQVGLRTPLNPPPLAHRGS